MKRVVVTGMGIVSSIGNSAKEVLASLREAKSGIVKADTYAELGFRCQVHGEPKIDWEGMIDRKLIEAEFGADEITGVEESGDEIIITGKESQKSFKKQGVLHASCQTCAHPNPIIYDILKII